MTPTSSLAFVLAAPPAAAADTPDDPWAALVGDELGEAWSDGLTHRAPRIGGFARADATAVAVADGPIFGAVTAGGAGRVGDGLALGATVTVNGFDVELATGPWTDVQSVGTELWAVTTRDGWRHGGCLGYYEPIGGTSSWYFRHPVESGRRMVARWVGWFDGDRVDLAFETRVGFGEAFAAEAVQSGAVAAELTRRIAVSAAAEVGFVPIGTVMVGLHARPVDHTEVGVTLATPFPLFSAVQPEPQVGAVVKGWFQL